MKHVVLALVGCLFSLNAFAACEAYCAPERSKPCGHGCISKYRQCHKSTTTACVGENPNRGSKPVYDNPKHVEPGSDTNKSTKAE